MYGRTTANGFEEGRVLARDAAEGKVSVRPTPPAYRRSDGTSVAREAWGAGSVGWTGLGVGRLPAVWEDLIELADRRGGDVG